jgi:hypothetical protein
LPTFKVEEKSTGTFEWKNVNGYTRIDE